MGIKFPRFPWKQLPSQAKKLLNYAQHMDLESRKLVKEWTAPSVEGKRVNSAAREFISLMAHLVSDGACLIKIVPAHMQVQYNLRGMHDFHVLPDFPAPEKGSQTTSPGGSSGKSSLNPKAAPFVQAWITKDPLPVVEARELDRAIFDEHEDMLREMLE